jgi:hypothetical protein
MCSAPLGSPRHSPAPGWPHDPRHHRRYPAIDPIHLFKKQHRQARDKLSRLLPGGCLLTRISGKRLLLILRFLLALPLPLPSIPFPPIPDTLRRRASGWRKGRFKCCWQSTVPWCVERRARISSCCERSVPLSISLSSHCPLTDSACRQGTGVRLEKRQHESTSR